MYILFKFYDPFDNMLVHHPKLYKIYILQTVVLIVSCIFPGCYIPDPLHKI